MFEREIKFIYDFNVNKLSKYGSFFSFEQMRNSDIHPAILQYISAELDYLIFEDRQKLVKDSIFDYSGENVSKYFAFINEELKKSKRLSSDYVSKIVLHSISFNVNFLVRPKWALAKFIYEDESHRTAAEIKQILNYLHFYKYLKKIIITYLNNKKIISLNSAEFIELLNKIDDVTLQSDYTGVLNTSLKSMAEFFNIGGVQKTKIPFNAVQMFLEDKGLDAQLSKLRDEYTEDSTGRLEFNDVYKMLVSVLVEKIEPVPVHEEETMETEPEPICHLFDREPEDKPEEVKPVEEEVIKEEQVQEETIEEEPLIEEPSFKNMVKEEPLIEKLFAEKSRIEEPEEFLSIEEEPILTGMEEKKAVPLEEEETESGITREEEEKIKELFKSNLPDYEVDLVKDEEAIESIFAKKSKLEETETDYGGLESLVGEETGNVNMKEKVIPEKENEDYDDWVFVEEEDHNDIIKEIAEPAEGETRKNKSPKKKTAEEEEEDLLLFEEDEEKSFNDILKEEEKQYKNNPNSGRKFEESHNDFSKLLENKSMTKIIDVLFDCDIEEVELMLNSISFFTKYSEAENFIDTYFVKMGIKRDSPEAITFKEIIRENYNKGSR